MSDTINFTRPYRTGDELRYLEMAAGSQALSGDADFSKKCQHWMEKELDVCKALLTPSCTAALEMAAILADIQPGDEVIMPSYTFVSTANAFVLRGAIPVFVDIRPDTLNLDENLIEAAITDKTKAIVPVHYAGVGCEMDRIMALAKQYDLIVIEDAAQGVMANYRDRALGSIGHLACFSFHDTKNISCGEGGALLINDPELVERAEIIREKGTNRSQFFRGQVDKYTWVDVGSSYLPSELSAAYLYAQLEHAAHITQKRLQAWQIYHEALVHNQHEKIERIQSIPKHCQHNAHMFYFLSHSESQRNEMLDTLRSQGIQASFHYIPLHSSPAGKQYARAHGKLEVTDSIAHRLIRLPLWAGLNKEQQERVIGALNGS